MNQHRRTPAYAVPDNIAWIDGADFGMAEELYLTVVPDGRTVLLKDSARLIWLVAADGGDDVVAEVAELVGRPPAEIEGDVRTFLADLVSRGLLAPAPGNARATSRDGAGERCLVSGSVLLLDGDSACGGPRPRQ